MASLQQDWVQFEIMFAIRVIADRKVELEWISSESPSRDDMVGWISGGRGQGETKVTVLGTRYKVHARYKYLCLPNTCEKKLPLIEKYLGMQCSIVSTYFNKTTPATR